MRSLVTILVVGSACLGFASVTFAQASPPSTSLSQDNDSLSTKLNKSDGVITPKADVDPGIHATAPDPHPNSTPIVPPGAVGGGTAK